MKERENNKKALEKGAKKAAAIVFAARISYNKFKGPYPNNTTSIESTQDIEKPTFHFSREQLKALQQWHFRNRTQKKELQQY